MAKRVEQKVVCFRFCFHMNKYSHTFMYVHVLSDTKISHHPWISGKVNEETSIKCGEMFRILAFVDYI